MNKIVAYPLRILRLFRRILLAGAIIASFTTINAIIPADAQAAKRIAIVSIDEDPSTIRTIKGVKKSLSRSGFAIDFQEVVLSGHSESDARIKQGKAHNCVGFFADSYRSRVRADNFTN